VKAIVACLLWASAFIFGKRCLMYIPPLRLAGERLLIASLLMLPFTWRKPWKILKGRLLSVISLAFFQTAVTFIFFNLGLNLVSGSIGSMVTGLSPVFSMLFAALCLPDEQLDGRRRIGLIVGTLGVLLLFVTRGYLNPKGRSEMAGMMLLLFSDCTAAYANIIAKRHLADCPVLQLNFLQTFIGSGMILVASLFVEYTVPLCAVGVPVVIDLFCLAFITAGATTLWLNIIQKPEVKVSRISAWKLLIPSVGALLSWLFLPDDVPTTAMFLGLVTIGISIILTITDVVFPKAASVKG